MTSPRYDLLGVGNAIVDVIAKADDKFLVTHGMAKGSMTLIDEPRAKAIYWPSELAAKSMYTPRLANSGTSLR